ncbi:polysaccharide biosynthesis-like protein [Halopseudomonas aestusnigri]|uniref:hypothetical protein n=1 Tax=Halopseudomonas TaxID=2901189 RepID=UPI0022B6E1BE|nr:MULTISPECIES: hypothetical protein [Halopseudomonas]BDX20537.1 polysaccharide biosynthesis-like protein [Halopseudomonas aestusnigri]
MSFNVKRRLLQGVFGLGFIGFMYSALNFIANIYISRVYGVESFASYSLFMSLAGLIGIYCSGGMDAIVMRSGSALEFEEKVKKAGAVVIYLTLSSVPLVAYYICFVKGMGGVEVLLYVVAAYTVGHNTFKQGVSAYLNNQSRYQAIDKSVRGGFGFVLLVIVGQMGIKEVLTPILLACLCMCLSFLATNAFVRRNGVDVNKPSWAIDASMVVPVFFVLACSFLVNLLVAIDFIFLSVADEPQAVAKYAAAQKLSIVSSVLIFSINLAAVPLLLRAKRAGDAPEANGVVAFAVVLSMLASFIYLLVCVFFGDYLLSLFGPQYEEADVQLVLIVLAASGLVNSLFGQTFTLMKVYCNEKPLSIFVMLAVVAKILVLMSFYDELGILAAGVGTLVATLVWNVMSFIYLLRVNGVSAIGIALKGVQ